MESAEVGSVRELTVGRGFADAAVSVAEHVNLFEVFARCLSWPWG